MSRKVLGLDIGITSVGYGVIDIDDNKLYKFKSDQLFDVHPYFNLDDDLKMERNLYLINT